MKTLATDVELSFDFEAAKSLDPIAPVARGSYCLLHLLFSCCTMPNTQVRRTRDRALPGAGKFMHTWTEGGKTIWHVNVCRFRRVLVFSKTGVNLMLFFNSGGKTFYEIHTNSLSVTRTPSPYPTPCCKASGPDWPGRTRHW